MAQKLRPQAETLSGSPQPNFIGYATAPIISKRAPTTLDLGYPLGQEWVDKVNANSYQLVKVAAGSATWAVLGGSTSAISTINTLSPSGGNITIGTANQLTVGNAGSTVTLSLPSAITAPGSLTTTTTLAAGTALSAGTTVTAGTGITATTGNITASTGDVVISTAAKGVVLGGGAKVVCGTGDPNTAVTAPKGSLYLRLDGSSSSTRAYINTDSATAWTAVTTAS
jgi:hypothetical protein